MPRFIHAADLHVDSPLRGLGSYEGAPAERIRQAARTALENLVKLAQDERASFVVIAGDVYDTNPMLETALFFRAQMQRLSDAGIPVVIVRGNHDHAGIAPKNLTLPAGVTVLPHDRAESVSLPGAGAVIHGRSYPRPDCDQDLVEGYPRPAAGLLNVGLLHTGLGGLDPEHGNYAPTTSSVLAAHGYQYWALGHIHRRQSIEAPGTCIEFPGNLQGRHAKELGAKGALLVEYEGSQIRSVGLRPLDVMRWHHLELNAQDATGELSAFVEERILHETGPDRDEGRLCAVRVTVGGVWRGPAKGLLGAEDLRELLLGSLQKVSGQLWLEKVAVRARPESADRSVVERRLSDIAAELAASPEMRRALASELAEVKKSIRRAHPDLLLGDLADAFGELERDEAGAILEQALELVRSSLRSAPCD